MKAARPHQYYREPLIDHKHVYNYLYAIVLMYTFINNNKIYIYDLYELVFTCGQWKSPENEEDSTRRRACIQKYEN